MIMDRIVNVGIIGCGGIANGKHMPSLSVIPNVRMVAFCDIIEEKAQAAAKKFGTPNAKVYTDYKELLKRRHMLSVCNTAATDNSDLDNSFTHDNFSLFQHRKCILYFDYSKYLPIFQCIFYLKSCTILFYSSNFTLSSQFYCV
jgi:hypothetical protein